ncbi:competence type IV pilus minor pilin ComGF [Periweissella beninensis]|uniref:Competence protein ComGF n=1 Tax=Periweissella beninensis TaxID=504936 RepID=A0ABT0VJM5_9LACO|nr:competence type IV pilus minor pilin ComGF [Periweissella beninensis]MBM7544530.1 competence protein ComGF [Periweissella beninensis]MCM2438028.1 hypothetical protein [Periweissella beninensis]MCT4396944.1 hypothetical protein [Periweissella beninensis]
MKRQNAFSLVEALTGLLILGLITGLLQMGVLLVKDSLITNKPAMYSWIQFLHNIETDQNPFYWQKLAADKTQLGLWRQNKENGEAKEYILKLTKKTHTLYMSGVDGGYMPFIYNVETVKFKKIKNNIQINVVFISGEHRNAILAIKNKKE